MLLVISMRLMSFIIVAFIGMGLTLLVSVTMLVLSGVCMCQANIVDRVVMVRDIAVMLLLVLVLPVILSLSMCLMSVIILAFIGMGLILLVSVIMLVLNGVCMCQATIVDLVVMVRALAVMLRLVLVLPAVLSLCLVAMVRALAVLLLLAVRPMVLALSTRLIILRKDNIIVRFHAILVNRSIVRDKCLTRAADLCHARGRLTCIVTLVRSLPQLARKPLLILVRRRVLRKQAPDFESEMGVW
mmetsp:Transcript_24992/g.63133  ORF Transcript_24992/g.63133 Transcript_24992/m.63133 type:complete len:243 (+) Transcript_24992:823-1551(+)